MLDGRNYSPGDPIFTWVSKEGENINIDSEKLRQWCADNRSNLEVLHTPVSRELCKTWVQDNVIDMAHVLRVFAMPRLDPIIYCHTGTYTEARPDVILADGHHRYFAAAMSGMVFIPSYILTPEQWKQFQIAGLPDITEEQLRAMPTKPRGDRT